MNVLADVEDAVVASVADDTHVYFATENLRCVELGNCPNPGGLLYRVPRCGGALEALTTTPKHYAELVDAGDVFYYLTSSNYVDGGTWHQAEKTEVGRVRKASGTIEVLGGFPAGMYGRLAANASHAYLLRGDAIHRVAHDATAVEPIATTTHLLACAELDSIARATAIAVDDRTLAWATGFTAYRAGLDGSNVTEIYTAERPIGAIALSADDTYIGTWTQTGCTSEWGGHGQLIRARMGMAAEVLLPDTEPSAFSVVGPYLYWSGGTGLERLRTDGSGAAELVSYDADVTPAFSGGDRVFAGPRAWRATALPTGEIPPVAEGPLWEIPATQASIEHAGVDANGDVLILAGVLDPGGSVGSAPLSGPGVGLPVFALSLLKVSPAGEPRWVTPLGNAVVSAMNPYVASRMVIGTDGSTLVVYDHGSGNPSVDYVSSSGAILWTRDYSYPVRGVTAALDADGFAYLAILGEDPPLLLQVRPDGTDGFGVGLSASLGAPLPLASRGVLAVTSAYGEPGFVRWFDQAGACRWALPVGGLSIDGIVPRPDGGALILAWSGGEEVNLGNWKSAGPTPGVRTALIASITASAEIDWIRWVPGTHAPGTWRIGADPDGAIYFAGVGAPFTDLGPGGDGGSAVQGQFVAKLDRDGDQVWTRGLPDGDLVVPPAGPLLVLGGSGVQAFAR